MSDTIFSVRIDEEIKNAFTNMAKEAGINNKEFMEQLISLYNLNRVTMNSVIDTESDISELQNISRRMVDIFSNLIAKMDLTVNECKRNKEDIIAQSEKLKEHHKEELKEAEEKASQLKHTIEELRKENDNLKKQIENNHENSASIKSLNKMQEEKLLELEGKLMEDEKQLESMELMKKRWEALKGENDELKNIVENYRINVEELNKKIQVLNKENADMSQQFEENYNNKLSLAIEKVELNKNREILQLKEDKYNELLRIQKEYSEKILSLTEENRLYQETIRKITEKAK
ncbi:hypothetical protein SAMN02745248_00008 [Hathewaya proteolytica DSM 3090]|uniref:Uncharacterized protein n=1 Tax=Hathewaya proteolytica DSM 3090 TaxID=1121331 RepID=A0A1M6J1W5_9CLOT|nr:hypothetical protein [Hathewaya proteolytica]SHJ40581.1 hypothetical protein SAMN02745248_00008 [Hathewaya proteolytica DSM 3090]